MYTFPVPLRHGLAIVMGLVMTTMAHAQQIVLASMSQEKPPARRTAEAPPASVHRIVILEGPHHRVEYVASGNLSASDRQAAFNLERAENELAYARDLQQLKRLYVNSELSMEPYRRGIQRRLYGRQITYSSYAANSVGYGPNRNYGYPGGLYGYYGANQPGMYSPYFSGGYRSGGAALGSFASTGYTERQSLQFGMGNEGRMKNAIVQTIATQSSPDYATAAVHNYQTALDNAAASPILSRDLGLSKSKKSSAAPAAEPNFTKGDKATIWVGNEKYSGTVKDDRPGWVVLRTDKGEVSVRKSEITRSETPSK